MAFDRPTLTELIDRVVADVESRLSGADARLRRSVLNVLAKVFAGAVHGLHGHLEWLGEQIIYDTASDEILERWAAIWNIERKAAAQATGTVTFTGTDGAQIPAGSLLQRSDGAEFTTDADATLASGTADVAVTAEEAGEDGNTDDGSTLTLVSPISGVDSDATASGDISGGTNIEDIEDLRARLLARIQQPPHGGSEADYEAWALEASGVTRAWVYSQYLGLGTVGVCIVNDDADPIIPDAAKIAEVQVYIDELRPVTADVTVFAPVEDTVDITLSVSPDTAVVRAAVEAELSDFFTRDAEPGGTIYLSNLHEAISAAEGEVYHTLTSPSADVAHDDGHIAVLGTVTWT